MLTGRQKGEKTVVVAPVGLATTSFSGSSRFNSSFHKSVPVQGRGQAAPMPRTRPAQDQSRSSSSSSSFVAMNQELDSMILRLSSPNSRSQIALSASQMQRSRAAEEFVGPAWDDSRISLPSPVQTPVPAQPPSFGQLTNQ